uniref:Uncharacterized protein n=1 Tax=Strongyloides stercoralis TaxID=6248 RepID=A0A0K0DVL4_STRER
MNTYHIVSYYNCQNTISSNSGSTFDSPCLSICSSCPDLRNLKYKMSKRKDYGVSQLKYTISNDITKKISNQNNQKYEGLKKENNKKDFFWSTCYNDSYQKPGTFVKTILIKKNHKTEIMHNERNMYSQNINDNKLSRTVYVKPSNKNISFNSSYHTNTK